MDETRQRSGYRLFSPGKIGSITPENRIVRSGTWDPPMVFSRRLGDDTLEIYRRLAAGGAGTIVVGDFDVVPKEARSNLGSAAESTYDGVRIDGFDRLADEVHAIAPGARIVAQVSTGIPGVAPSDVVSPFTGKRPRALEVGEIRALVECFAMAIEGVRSDGFDGVQLHAAHGSFLCRFLSPYSNRRSDAHGGSPAGRTRLIREIVAAARERVGDFPILIKMNGTDYLDEGLDLPALKEQAALLAEAGIDAIEISGGLWECLLRPEEDLGFPPVPAPESHVGIADPAKQSYFLPYARALDADVPVILGGGNRDVERIESILTDGDADYIAISRPLIREPDLPHRWREGRGPSGPACVSCNGCIYDMVTGIRAGKPRDVRCLIDHEPERLKEADAWLSGWVETHTRRRTEEDDG